MRCRGWARAAVAAAAWALLAGCAAAGCSPWIEPIAVASARLRPHRDAFRDCVVSEAAYAALVGAWLGQRAPDAPPLSTFGLGRAVDLPWISEYLAAAASSAPAWDNRRGRARRGEAADVVITLLEAPAFAERLIAPFAAFGYRLERVSVEKVLVEDRRARGLGRVPFDAQLWLTLAR